MRSVIGYSTNVLYKDSLQDLKDALFVVAVDIWCDRIILESFGDFGRVGAVEEREDDEPIELKTNGGRESRTRLPCTAHRRGQQVGSRYLSRR